eukprot:gene43764-58317_t
MASLVTLKNDAGKRSKNAENCVKVLKGFGIDVVVYKGHKEREIFVVIGSSLNVLRDFADTIEFDFLMDESKLEQYAANGDPENHISPIVIQHMPEETSIRPFELIFGDYKKGLPEQLYWRSRFAEHPFRDLYRLKLMVLLIESKTNLDDGKNIEIN